MTPSIVALAKSKSYLRFRLSGGFVKEFDSDWYRVGWHKPCHYSLPKDGGAEWHSN